MWEAVVKALPLMKGERGCLEEGWLWLMEQDFMRCIAWAQDSLKSLEGKGKMICEMSGTMLFGCNLKHLQYLHERR